MYRIVYFRPKLTLEWKIPILAILKENNKHEIVLATLLPKADSLESKGSYELLIHGISRFLSSSEDTQPFVSVGPHFEIGFAHPFPLGIRNKKEWIQRNLLPNRKEVK